MHAARNHTTGLNAPVSYPTRKTEPYARNHAQQTTRSRSQKKTDFDPFVVLWEALVIVDCNSRERSSRSRLFEYRYALEQVVSFTAYRNLARLVFKELSVPPDPMAGDLGPKFCYAFNCVILKSCSTLFSGGWTKPW